MVKKTVYIYKSFERFWHWTQALLIFFLATTGFEIHGSIRFFGYENAVEYHNAASYAFIVLIFFAIFWHLTTGEWKQYVPTMKNIKAEINYYLIGIFRNVPHPTRKTVLSKLNPLQKLVYFGLKILVIPVMVVSGILYMFYRYPQQDSIVGIKIDSLESIAVVHTAGAFLLIAFIVVHLYLMTTGATLTSNLKAMLTGYEEIDGEEKDSSKIFEGRNIAGAEIKKSSN
ncbi:MAG: cytochrome b/b6 domain-containing protein [Ignavibacteria bacterium]|nr:cytochrome b/b6 domain-containing protein [Ignavibacteria bacterium]